MENLIVIEVYHTYPQDDELYSLVERKIIENSFNSIKEFLEDYLFDEVEEMTEEEEIVEDDLLAQFMTGESKIYNYYSYGDWDDPDGYEFRIYSKEEKIQELQGQITLIEDLFENYNSK